MSFDGADDEIVYSPTPALPEIFLDLDLMLITAADEKALESALMAGTSEVLCRFEHLADKQVFCASSSTVIADISTAARRLDELNASALALWLRGEILEVLTAHYKLQQLCIELSRTDTAAAVSEVAALLDAAARNMAARQFAEFPKTPCGGWGFDVQLAVLSAMSAEFRRNSLRNQLDGAGGAAGSPEFNPFVRGMCELELVTHRRSYRLLYSLAEHVGVDLRDDELFQSPEIVESQTF